MAKYSDEYGWSDLTPEEYEALRQKFIRIAKTQPTLRRYSLAEWKALSEGERAQIHEEYMEALRVRLARRTDWIWEGGRIQDFAGVWPVPSNPEPGEESHEPFRPMGP